MKKRKDEPLDLPEAVARVEEDIIPPSARNCPLCQRPARIVSDFEGRSGHCGRCKHSWPIGPPVVVHGRPIRGRGLTKETTIEPDWNLLNEDLD